MKKKVLLVFFEAFKLKEIKELLEKEDFQVLIAFDGAEGYEMFKNEKPDLVITEALLPRVHGFELCQRIRTESEMKIPVIIVTGTYKGTRFRNEALTKYNATAFIEYPFDTNEFLEVIKDSISPKEEELFKTIPIKADTKEFLKDAGGEKKVTAEELFGGILKELEHPTKDEKGVDFQFFQKKEAEKKAVEREVIEESEEDLEKKLEETLSGLGIKVKVKPSTEKKKEEKPSLEKEKTLEVLEEKPSIEPPPKLFVPQEEKHVEELIKEEKEYVEEIKKEEAPTVEVPPILPAEEKVEKIKVEIPAKETIGDYILEEKIATGGMAEIFKAKRKGVEGFEKTVVVKRILPSVAEDREFIDMLIDEAKIASQLSHPNIVQIFDLGKKEGSYFIAMEYVHGKDLRTILKTLSSRGRLLPFELSAYIGMKICDALYYAHNKKDSSGRPLKIVHRDVSPQNILISYDGDVKLTDFGVAKASTKLHQTVAGQIKGKMLYMSPEQSKGSKEVDFRSDIYSLGCVLFEMITGKKLFMADSEMAVLEKVQKGKIVKPTKLNPEVPAQLESIVLKALKPRPSERYQSALEMKKDLEKFILSRRKTIPDNHELSLFMAELFPGEFAFLPPVRERVEILEATRREAPQIFQAFEGKEEKRRVSKPLIFALVLAILLLMGYLAYNFLYLPSSRKSPGTEIAKKSEIVHPQPVEKKEEAPHEEAKESLETPRIEKQELKEEAKEILPTPEVKSTREVQKQPFKTEPQKRIEPQRLAKERLPVPPEEEKKVEEKPVEIVKQEETPKEVVPPQEPPKQEEVVEEKVKEEPKPQKVEEVKPQPPPLKEGDLLPLEEVDVKPSAIKKVQPRLTITAERASAHGEILLNVLISETGDVLNVKLVKGVSKTLGMNEEAMKAVKQWKFSPAIKSGKRVKVWMLVLVKF